MTTTTERSRLLRAAEVFGWVGLVVSVVLAIAVLWAHGQIAGRVDETFASVDQALDRGTVAVTLASGRLQERVADLDTFITEATALDRASAVPAALAERADRIAERYSLIRDEYVAVRARIDSALATLQNVSRLLPGVEVGSGAAEALASLDERVASFDASLAGLRADARSTVERVATAVTSVRTGVDGVLGVTDRIGSGIQDVQARVAKANDTIDGFLWMITIVVLLVLAYVAALNGLVIRLARR